MSPSRVRRAAVGWLLVWNLLRAQPAYEIILPTVPGEPPWAVAVEHLGESGEVAGHLFTPGGYRIFIADWPAGATNLADIRIFDMADFPVPPDVTWGGLEWQDFSGHGEAIVNLAGFRRRQDGLGQLVSWFYRYVDGDLVLLRQFEGTDQARWPAHRMYFQRDGIHHLTGLAGDESNRFPDGGQPPVIPETWLLTDAGGTTYRLPTGPGVLAGAGEYRFLTRFFDGINRDGMIINRTDYVVEPLNPIQPATRTRHEVWVGRFPVPLGVHLGNASLTGAEAWTINDDGEITGRIPRGQGVADAYIHLPRPRYGRGAGLHVIGSGSAPVASRINRQGQVVWGRHPREDAQLWANGVSTPLGSLRQSGEGPDQLLPTRVLLNDRGWVAGQALSAVHSASNQPPHPFIMRPLVDAEAFVSTNRVRVGDIFTFTLRVRNLQQSPRTITLPLGFRFQGSARFELVGGPTPPAPRVVPARGTLEIHQQIRAVTNGIATWSSQARLTGGGATNDTSMAHAEAVHVLDPGDLMIRRADEPAALFTGEGIYQPAPVGPQLRAVSQGTGETNQFALRLVNRGQVASRYVLRTRVSDPTRWQVQVRTADGSPTTALAGAGWVTPNLAPGATLDAVFSVAARGATNGQVVAVTTSIANPGNAEVIDAVGAAVTLTDVPVQAVLHRAGPGAYTPQSIDAGRVDADAPLRWVADRAVLDTQPAIAGGWVADGVTPLLIRLHAPPGTLVGSADGRRFEARVEVESGGSLEGIDLDRSLEVLGRGGWEQTRRFTLTADTPVAFITLPPVPSDALRLGVPAEMVLALQVNDVASGETAGQLRFRLRKPPVVLIHGYNTDGSWGPQFIAALDRGLDRNGTGSDWVRVARYGQATAPGRTAYVSQLVNTLASLTELVPLAEAAFAEAIAPLREQWAFTRFDAVCHSQGGLLTRMLCTALPNRDLALPFRNAENHYRGRFHRVVTLGSPHNGTRLLRYLLALDAEKTRLLRNNLPLVIGSLGVLSEVAQQKFDPFGVGIRDLNAPAPDGRWLPDPAAEFHLVRTTINQGRAPDPFLEVPAPSYLLLGLVHPVAGPAVLPRGSDGVVDFDSMGAHGPDQPAAPNVHTFPTGLEVAHSPPLTVFGAEAGQTSSLDVAEHVRAVLDQSDSLPGATRAFGPFPVPPRLPDTVRAQIDTWAAATVIEFVGSAIQASSARPAAPAAGSGTRLRHRLSIPANRPPDGPVAWAAEAYTANGIEPDLVQVEPDPAAPGEVSLTVPAGFVGDVVLHAGYRTASGIVVLSEPVRVHRVEPEGNPVIGIMVEPDAVRLPAGAEVPALVRTLHADGTSLLRHAGPGEVATTSSDPTVVDASAGTRWRLGRPGRATLTTTHLGFRSTNQITVYAPMPPGGLALRVNLTSDGVDLRWDGGFPGAVLESTPDLTGSAEWEPVPTDPVPDGDELGVVEPVTAAGRLYRLRLPPSPDGE